MLPRALPPVRRRVSLRRTTPTAGRRFVRDFFGGREVLLLRSGTAALAAALIECRRKRAVDGPEAILPAYACPDLVSACEYAHVRPRLVDVAAGTWGFDQDALRSAVSAKTVAILAVNFLGLGDGAAELTAIARQAGAVLIQDSAQHLPRDPRAAWYGDYLVFSFGRGKPMNLLRGGALVLPQGESSAALEGVISNEQGPSDRFLSTRLAGVLFNAVTSPVAYWWMCRLPGMGLGETRFKPLHSIRALPERAWGQVGAELSVFLDKASYDASPWSPMVESWRALGITPLHASAAVSQPRDLLRLPLLAPNGHLRDRLVQALNREGLGATAMYALALNRLPDVPRDVAKQGPFPNAEELAARLFTLPTHSLVSPRVIAGADRIVRGLLS